MGESSDALPQQSGTRGNFEDSTNTMIVLGRALDIFESANLLPYRFTLPDSTYQYTSTEVD